MLKHLVKQSPHSALSDIESVKFSIIKKVSFYALFIHILLTLIFAHIGSHLLAFVNIFSVIAWASGIFLINQGLTSLALRIFCLEVLLHSVIACATLGMDAGFQYYLWTVTCLLMIDYQLSLKRAATYSCLLIIIFASLNLLFGDVQYSYLYPSAITYVHIINILIAGLPMVYAIGLIREITISQRIKLTDMASQDHLTKLYNRRFAKKLIEQAHRQSVKDESAITLVMADIDHFKHINDSYGHDKGDQILLKVANHLKQALNEYDIAVRWGGEEFLLVLVNTNKQEAFQRIEQLRESIAAQSLLKAEQDINLTMSFGLIEWQPLAPLEKMLQQADAALYESKNKGRNNTTIATNDQLQLAN